MFKMNKKIFLLITLISLTINVVHGMRGWRVKGSCRPFFSGVWQKRWHRRYKCGGYKKRRCGRQRYGFIQLWVDKAITELKKEKKAKGDKTPITKDEIKKKILADPDFQKAWDDLIAKLAGRPGFRRSGVKPKMARVKGKWPRGPGRGRGFRKR